MMLVVFLGAVILLTLHVLFPQRFLASQQRSASNSKRGLANWWNTLSASPDHQGIALLLIWQLVPLFYLLHHTIVLFEHYILFFLPGPFILVAVGLTKNLELMQRFRPDWKRLTVYLTCILAALLIGAQFLGNTISLLDQTTGRIPNNKIYAGAEFNDLDALQNALQEVDLLAQQRHIHRIYGIYNPTLNKAIKYLSEFMRTPISLYDPNQCMLLPAFSSGPALFLTVPDYPLQNLLLNTFANATLLAQSERLGHPHTPFQIYQVTAKASPDPGSQTFTSGLQSISASAQLFKYRNPNASWQNAQWLVTRWRVLDTHKFVLLTTYNYNFQIQPDSVETKCDLTETWAGDQLFAFQQSALGSAVPRHITVQASTCITEPELLHVGSLNLETSYMENTQVRNLFTADSRSSLTFAVQLA